MGTTMCTGCIPVSGPINHKGRTGKGEIRFRVCEIQFFLPENSTYAKMIMGSDRAIVLYKVVGGRKNNEVVEVVPNFTWQQVLQINSRYTV